MTGFIYLITNRVNGKQYIGQTVKTIEERWERHIVDSHRLNEFGEYKYDNKINRAIRKYDWRNFSIQVIGEYNAEDLDKMEIHFIEMYDTFNNGYNSTLGGGGVKLLKDYTDEEIKECIKLYRSGLNINEINKILDISYRNIMKIINEHIPNEVRNNKNLSKAIIMMNKQGGIVKEFNSLWEAYNWIKEDRPALKHTNAYYLIKKAALNGNTAYGYRWKFVGNVE